MSVFQLEDFDQCCRCCLIKARQLESLFGVHLSEMLSEILNVKVEINDGYPAQICVSCIRKMTMAVNFKRLVLASYEKLTNIIKNPNNTVNNGTEDNAIEFSDEVKHELNINDDSDINNTNKVEDLNLEFGDEVKHELNINDDSDINNTNKVEDLNLEFGDEVKHELNINDDSDINNTNKVEDLNNETVCNAEGKWFKWRTSLYKHARTHDGRLYSCPVCGNEYADSSYLRIHERKHNSEDVRLSFR